MPIEACADLNGNDGTVEKPINRESCMSELVSSFITEHDNYDRNHGPIMHISACSHIVELDGLVRKPLQLKVAELSRDFPQHSVTCALQCAGNRRHTMRTRIKEVQGIDWFDGALMNCKLEGPRLRDVLLQAGVDEKDCENAGLHVQFASRSSKTKDDEWYGGSIPFDRAMREDQDVIVALKMNGRPLPARHGFPVRMIVPGVLGARSVKWLDRITVADKESPCFYQQRDYKILPPSATCAESAEKYWDQTPAMLDMPINTCVATPVSGSTISLGPSGLVKVKGYAVPQADQGPVVRVEVSGDEGKTWTDAWIDNGGKEASKWSWVLWNVAVKMERGKGRRIFARATDTGGNVQKEPISCWNLRGVGYNGYEVAFDVTVV